ncbi:MAG: DUF6959 family protein [Planctomycetota bacterium]|jgi:hypothetical protein
MPNEYPDEIVLYDHVPNSGIVHLPGRRFPGIAIQGDSMSSLLSEALSFMAKAREYDDEEMYYGALEMAETFRSHLLRYEEVLAREGFDKPYTLDVKGLALDEEFKGS